MGGGFYTREGWVLNSREVWGSMLGAGPPHQGGAWLPHQGGTSTPGMGGASTLGRGGASTPVGPQS